MRFPWAPVQSLQMALESPQLRARNFFIPVDHPEYETTLPYAGSPYRLLCPSTEKRKRAPLIGEDNVHVYHKELGFSDQELEELSSTGVI